MKNNRRKKIVPAVLLIVALLILVTYYIHEEGFLYFKDGPYSGKVIDADSKEPIAGAVVLAVWNLEFHGGPAGALEKLCDVKVTTTDTKGEFTVSKGSCFHLWPFTDIDKARFTIFKPGYDSYPPSLPVVTGSFTPEDWEAKYRYQREYWVPIEKRKANLVRLKKTHNVKERRWVAGSISLAQIPEEMIRSNLTIVVDMINEERKFLGLKPIYGGAR